MELLILTIVVLLIVIVVQWSRFSAQAAEDMEKIKSLMEVNFKLAEEVTGLKSLLDHNYEKGMYR